MMRRSWESHRSLLQLPQRLVRTVQGLNHVATLSVFPLVQPMGNRPLEAVEPGFRDSLK
jgi:hypothetical protein